MIKPTLEQLLIMTTICLLGHRENGESSRSDDVVAALQDALTVFGKVSNHVANLPEDDERPLRTVRR